MIRAEMTTITPEVAKEMLEHNTENYRRIKRDRVAQYARQMALGLWRENGEGIQFSEDGTLLNGQHRLNAVVESGATVQMLVVRGVKKENGVTYDYGSARTWSDFAKGCLGHSLHTAIGGAVSLIIAMQLGNNTHIGISAAEKMDYYERHQDDLYKAFVFCSGGNRKRPLRIGGCVGAVYCAIRLNLMPERDLSAFCTMAISGYPDGIHNCEVPLTVVRSLAEAPKDGHGENAFSIMWQGLMAFKNGSKSKKAIRANPDIAQAVIRRVIELERMVGE